MNILEKIAEILSGEVRKRENMENPVSMGMQQTFKDAFVFRLTKDILHSRNGSKIVFSYDKDTQETSETLANVLNILPHGASNYAFAKPVYLSFEVVGEKGTVKIASMSEWIDEALKKMS